MAHSTLAALSHPEFPQLDALDGMETMQQIVDRVLLAYKRPVLDLCQYETPETSPGACNGLPCAAKATVFDQETESEYCLRHFMEVSRG